MPQYLSAAIVEDYCLYPIHRTNGVVQYAGHVMLWEATELQARNIASGLCQAPIVGVEIVIATKPGEDDIPVVTIGMDFKQAEAL